MNQIKHFGRKFIKGSFKFLIGLLLLIITLIVGVVVALQIPYVQTKVVNKTAEYLSETLGFPIHIEGVQIDWLDEFVLEGVSVTDPRGGKMISLNEVVVDFEIISFTQAKFNIDDVILRNGRVNMIRYAPDGMGNMTEFINIIRELTTPKVRRKKPVPFTIDEVSLENMYFSYFDKRKLLITDGFDHNHFSFDSIYATVDELRSVADTFQLDIKNLRAIENNINLPVHNLNTLFTITKGDMTFDNLVANIGHSYVKDYLRFNYSDINDLSDFNSKIDIIANLDESYIDFQDLAHFAPELKGFRERVKLTALLKGKVNNFYAKGVSLNFGKRSKIEGTLSFDGLPNFNETSIQLKFNSLAVHSEDLSQYVNENTYTVLRKFGNIKGKGEFQGFPSDFVTYGNFQTDLGYLVSDIKLDGNSEDIPLYEGKLQTKNFQLGKLLNIPEIVQAVDMNGTVNGEGFTLEDLKLNFNGKISRLGIYGYNYRNISTNATLKKSFFDGKIQVKDSNLVLLANGKIDLSIGKEDFDIEANISRANLKPLNLSPVEASLRTNLDLEFKGTNIDCIVGNATFNETFLSYSDKEISIDTLYIKSEKENDLRHFILNSNLLTFSAIGDFNFSTLYNDLDVLYEEYKINFTKNTQSIHNYYSVKKNDNTEKYFVNFDMNIKNLNALFEIYTPGLYLSENIILNGSFHNGLNSQLDFNTSIDTLYYKGNEIYNSQVDVSTSKMADSSNILAMIYVASERQKISDLPASRNFIFEGIWDQNNINFTTRLSQQDSDNNLDLRGSLDFLETERYLHLYNSNLNLLGQTWKITEENKVHFSHNRISFENFIIQNGNEFVSLNGTLSEQPAEVAILEVGNFQVSYLDGLISENNLQGTLNGKMAIKDIFTHLDIAGNVIINDFAVDGFLIGNVKGKSSWDTQKQRLILNIDLERQNEVTATLKGFVIPRSADAKEQIDMNAYLENADLSIISPLLKDVMSDISGRVSGNIHVGGSFDNISVSGKAEVRKGKFKIDYLGTTYSFEDNIYLEENLIGFKKLKLKDEFGNYGIINGGIFHDGFKDFLVDIRGNLQELNTLNLTEKDNNLFYGNAFVTGNFEIIGPFSNLTINANAKSNKGTKIYIPLNSSTSALEQQEHIKFVARSKGVGRDDKEKSIDLSGLNLDFNFELTPDAYAELIFDKRAGDIIRGYGNGNIKMTIDTRGDFNMYGNYRIAKGAYNYTLVGVNLKEFTIEPGSTIMWTGDPYGGILDVKAYFENKIPITPLLDSTRIKLEQGRTHPVKVILDLDGELMSPQIGLDIDIQPTTALATEVATSFEAEIKRNEQELNRQVFSLLVLGSFSPSNSFTGIGGSVSNVSQLLTNQLGNWLSQMDENLIIDIDLNGLDKEALNTFNLRLSYTLLEGRLRVSRDGSFSNFQSTQQQNLSNIAGEWTVEYLLSQEGKFRLKLYNKNNQNLLLNSLNSNAYSSAGFSILHTQSFNNIGELLGIKKKKKTENKPVDEKDPSQPPADTTNTSRKPDEELLDID